MRTLKWVLAKAGCDVDTWPNHVEPLTEPIKVDVAAATAFAHKLESEIKARRVSEVVTRALVNQKETKVEWIEPSETGTGQETLSKTVEEAIAQQRAVGVLHGFTYSSDCKALLDFMVVNWAQLLFPETAKPPCSEPYCHDCTHTHVGDSETNSPPKPAWYPCECGRLVPIWTANGWCANCNRAVYPTTDLTTPHTVRGCVRCRIPLNAGGQCDACAGHGRQKHGRV
jgi:hypothetical protein